MADVTGGDSQVMLVREVFRHSDFHDTGRWAIECICRRHWSSALDVLLQQCGHAKFYVSHSRSPSGPAGPVQQRLEITTASESSQLLGRTLREPASHRGQKFSSGLVTSGGRKLCAVVALFGFLLVVIEYNEKKQRKKITEDRAKGRVRRPDTTICASSRAKIIAAARRFLSARQ